MINGEMGCWSLNGENADLIKLVVATVLFFGLAVLLHFDKKKKEKEQYEKLSDGTKSQSYLDYENQLNGNMPLKNEWEPRNRRDAEDLRSGMGKVLVVRYMDWICLLGGILCLGMLWGKITTNPYKDVVMRWVLGGIVVIIFILVGVVYYLRTDIGENTKTITGTVINVYKKMRGYGDYRMDVAWTDEKGRNRVYSCPYNFRKHNRPQVGSEYELLYSYKYDNVKTRAEIRQGRRYSFYCFGLAVFWVVIMLVNLTL